MQCADIGRAMSIQVLRSIKNRALARGWVPVGLGRMKFAWCRLHSAGCGTQASKLNQTMMEMSREMMKAGLIDEMMSDAIDDAVDGGDVEQETDAEVDKVSPQTPRTPCHTALGRHTHVKAPLLICCKTRCEFCRGISIAVS